MEKTSNPYNLSASTLKALARFGPGNTSNSATASKLPPLPLPATDWELWAYMPKATLTETVAVSLGIDPSATKAGSGYVEPGKEYDRRLKIACAYVSHAGPLKSLDALPPMHMLYGPATATVSLPQFAEWALSMGWTLPEKFPRWKAAPAKTVTQTPAPAQSPAPPAPVAEIALGEPAKAGPVPVTTRAMADSFAGLHWDGEQWIKKLGDKPVWLDGCLVLNRGRGEGMRQWNPVLIGAYLVRMGHVKANSVRAKFQTQLALKPWLEEWKTYEADNFPTK